MSARDGHKGGKIELADLDPEERVDAVQGAIKARIKQFEITALLDLLESLGYGLGMLEFRGHPSASPQPTLLHDIDFPKRHAGPNEPARVIITVNLGLLSCRSPLPSYFSRLLGSTDYREGVTELLETLDCSLLHVRLSCDRPQRTIAGWEQAERDFLRGMGLNSPVGLQWLCRQIFPELGVLVRRVEDMRELDTVGARLDGVSKLGESSFGRRTRIGVQELELLLICEDARYSRLRSWVDVGKQRLRDHVFPLLDEVCVTLTVSFVLLDRGTRARLSDAPPSYVGYDPMLESHDVALDPPSRIRVYRGTLPRTEPDTHDLERVLAEERSATLELLDRGVGEDSRRALGQRVRLPLLFKGPGRRHLYLATVDWGVRPWYSDEPREISVAYRGEVVGEPEMIPKAPVSPAEHPRLWALAREHARQRLGAATLRHVRRGEPVTGPLIQSLIERRDYESLYALSSTQITPAERWDEDAWRLYSSWRSA